MPKFSEVFSTTFKVVAALFLLSLIAGVIYFFMTHVSESSNARETLDDVHQAQAQRYAAAEAKHTSMPLSRWNKIVAAAIKQRCAFEGMYKDDVEKAFGKPTETQHNYDQSDTWTFISEDARKCVKYDGDKCVEHPKNKDIVFLSPGGYVYLGDTGAGCYEQPFFGLMEAGQ
jgi:hypothetical protein